MKTKTNRVELTLNDTQRVNLLKSLKAFIHFDFEKRSKKEFTAVYNELSQINIAPDQVLHDNKEFHQEYMGQINNSDDFYEKCKKIFQGNQHAQSFYNYGRGLSDELSYIQNLYQGCLETIDGIKNIKNTALLDINFNSADSFGTFKDLCDTIRDSFAFSWRKTKMENGLSTICNDSWELDEGKMQNLHDKFRLTINKDNGKISSKKLEEYKSDRTVMDFLYMILSYLPKAIKDFVGLDEEKCNRWQMKAEFKPAIAALNHF